MVNSPEVQSAFQLKLTSQQPLKIRNYFQFLGEMSKYFRTVGFSGTNGKSSSSALAITTAKKLIPQLENLRKSLLNLNDEQKESTMGKGLLMMQEGFYRVLSEMGIEPIASIGLEPDAQYHEPVSMQPVTDDSLKGKIVQEFEQGFLFKNGEETLVLNPAKVVVGS